MTDRIVILAHGHPSFAAGGAEVVAYESFKGFRRSGHDVRFYAVMDHFRSHRTWAGIFQIEEDAYGAISKDFNAFSCMHKDVSLLYDLIKHIADYEPDVVHVHHFLYVGIDFISKLRSALPRAVFAITLHEYFALCLHGGQMVRVGDLGLCSLSHPQSCAQCFPTITADDFRLRQQMMFSFLSDFDVIFSPSSFLAERFHASGFHGKINIVENAIPRPNMGSRIASDAEERPAAWHFGFFGQVTNFKGIPLLIKAAMAVIETESRFRLSIHGFFVEEAERLLSRKQLHDLRKFEDNLKFFGPYGRSNLYRKMLSVDWVVVPSIWWENSPVVIQEAFHLRRPPIVADIGGMREKVADDVNGLHFRARDAGHLAETFRKAAGNTSLWNRLHENAPRPPSVEETNTILMNCYRKG